jgi:hypothetical protein
MQINGISKISKITGFFISINNFFHCMFCNKHILMFRDRGSGWPTVGDQYGSRGKMQATNQHSGTLLRGRKGKGGNKGINKRLYEI